MAWSEQGFRFAVARLPLPGTGLDEFDRYAIGSAIAAGDPDFRTFNYGDRLVLANNSLVQTQGTWSYADRLSIGRVPGGLVEGGGTVVELFETNWILDPTWTLDELPKLNLGALSAVIQGFSISMSGQSLILFDTERLITVNPATDTINVGAEPDVYGVGIESNTLKVEE